MNTATASPTSITLKAAEHVPPEVPIPPNTTPEIEPAWQPEPEISPPTPDTIEPLTPGGPEIVPSPTLPD